MNQSDYRLGFPPVLLALRDERPICDPYTGLASGWALGVPVRIFSEGEDKWRDNPDRMRLRELLHFECVDWTLFATCLYGVDKQPDITGPAPEVDDELSSRLSAHFARTRVTAAPAYKVGDRVLTRIGYAGLDHQLALIVKEVRAESHCAHECLLRADREDGKIEDGWYAFSDLEPQATIKVGDKVRVIRSKHGAPAKFDQQSGIVEEANDSIAVRFEGEHLLWWYTESELIKE